MDKFIRLIVLLLCFTAIIACNPNSEPNNQAKPETPKALKDGGMDVVSYSRSGNLIEELYSEFTEKDPQLKKLDKNLTDLNSESSDLSIIYSKYDVKSQNYYYSADGLASSISDSLLRQEIKSFLLTSKSKYSKRVVELNRLLNEIDANEIAIKDMHVLLKIALTIPVIEKFQKENLPNKKSFEELLLKQASLLKLIDSLRPN